MGFVDAATSPPTWLQKNSFTKDVIKILVTNLILCNRKYLKLPIFECVKNKVKEKKKLINSVYSTFDMFTDIISLLLSTAHSILSPGSNSNICAIVNGTVVRTELVFDVPFEIVVFCLNNITIPLNFIFYYTYISIIKYINLSFSIIFKKVIFIYNLNLTICKKKFQSGNSERLLLKKSKRRDLNGKNIL